MLFTVGSANRVYDWTQFHTGGGAYVFQNEDNEQDYVCFASVGRDELVTMRVSGAGSRLTAVGSGTALSQTELYMRGNLTAELVGPHWSAADLAPVYEEEEVVIP